MYQVTVVDVEVGNAPTWRIRLAQRGRARQSNESATAATPDPRPPPADPRRGAVAWIADPALIEMFYDGITPWTVAQNTVQGSSRKKEGLGGH